MSYIYRKIYNIRRTKSQNLTESRLVWQLFMSSTTMHNLHSHYREYQLLMKRNGTWHVCDERITKYVLFNTNANCLEILTDSLQEFNSRISTHTDDHFFMYRMSLKQILHDKNIKIEIHATHWEVQLNFAWTYKILTSLMSVLLIWSIVFYLFPTAL